MGLNRLGTLRLIALLQHFRWGPAAETVVRRVILGKKKKVVKRKLLFWLMQTPENTDHTYINPMSHHSHGRWWKETLLRNMALAKVRRWEDFSSKGDAIVSA